MILPSTATPALDRVEMRPLTADRFRKTVCKARA